MQITAKLVQLLPLQTGTGKNGEWKKQDIIVETDGQYPKKICISIWGDKINSGQLTPGNVLTVDFDVESREYNGQWYTDCKAWKVESSAGGKSETTTTKTTTTSDSLEGTTFTNTNEPDDLPF